MAKQNAPDYNRLSLITTVLLIGTISLLQSGCNFGSSGSLGTAVVAAVSPEQSSDTALVSTDVFAFFGRDMDETTINESTFTLIEVGGAEVAATVSYDAATRSARLDPDTDLISGTQYTATISAAVLDTNGTTPLTRDYAWSFSVSLATELVSKDINRAVGNNDSTNAAIDGTGRYVVFVSRATNLQTTAVTPGISHIYRKNTLTGDVLLVSSTSPDSSTDEVLEANDNSFSPRISDNGRYVVFSSSANNLSPITLGIPQQQQVYIKDLSTGDVSLVSSDITGNAVANAPSGNPDVSNDGRYVAFESGASNLTALPNSGRTQIYRRDMSNDATEMISRNTAQTAGGLGDSNRPSMSPDARFIVFDSDAGNSIVTGATGDRHVYLVDMNNPDVTEQISVDDNGIQASGTSLNARVNDDGNYVVFESDAANLVAGGTGRSDIYRRDRPVSQTLLVSTPDGINSGDVGSFNASISSDGNFVAFESASINLVIESVLGLTDIFVRDLSTLPTVTIEKINFTQSGLEAGDTSGNASISSDGRYISFESPFNYDVTDTNTLNDIYRSHNSTF